MLAETIAPLSDDPIVCLPGVAASATQLDHPSKAFRVAPN
jgi:hypothetical protein